MVKPLRHRGQTHSAGLICFDMVQTSTSVSWEALRARRHTIPRISLLE